MRCSRPPSFSSAVQPLGLVALAISACLVTARHARAQIQIQSQPQFQIGTGSLPPGSAEVLPDSPGSLLAAAPLPLGRAAFESSAQTAQPQAAQGQPAQTEPAQTRQTQAKPSPQSIPTATGTLRDASGAVIPNATITITGATLPAPLVTYSDGTGQFTLPSLNPGTYQVTFADTGFAPSTFTLQVAQNRHLLGILSTVTLSPTVSNADVTVTASQHEVAEAEMKVEETQRIAGLIPNFFVSYDWHAAPLSTGQKFHLANHTVIDPVSLVLNGAFAGLQQAENDYPGYGQGSAGYFKRFGAENADYVTGTYLGGAIFPAIFHQDPRYFFMGSGTVTHRLLYSLSTAVICRGDNGKWQFSYSGVLGDLSAGAISNLYYPASSRNGPALTFENGLLGIVFDGVGNAVQEFLIPHLTPHRPQYPTP